MDLKVALNFFLLVLITLFVYINVIAMAKGKGKAGHKSAKQRNNTSPTKHRASTTKGRSPKKASNKEAVCQTEDMHKMVYRVNRRGKVIRYCSNCGRIKSEGSGKSKTNQLDVSSPMTTELFTQVSRLTPVIGPGRSDPVSHRENVVRKKQNGGLLGQLRGHFASRQHVIPTVYRHFEKKPEDDPRAVIYETKLYTSHKEVSDAVNSSIQIIPGSKVVGIKYMPQGIKFHVRNMIDRWIIQVVPEEAVEYLVKFGFTMEYKNVKVRHYDTVMADEYKQFQGLRKMMNLLIRSEYVSKHLFQYKRV